MELTVVGAGDQRRVGVLPHTVLCGASGAVFCVRGRGLAGGGGPRGVGDCTAAEARTGRSGVPAQRGEWWRRREGGDPGTRIPPPLRTPLQRRSLEILALAGPAVLEAPGLEDSTGPGRRLRVGGSGDRGLEIREQPRSARRGLPAEAGGGPETVEDQAETKKRGAGASRRDRTSGSPTAEGRALLAPVLGRRRSGPRAPGTRNYAPRAGPRCGANGRGWGEVARSRRAPRPGAVIERLAARPSLGCSPPTQPFIHSSVLSPSTHLLPKHVSGLSSVHPIIAPGITLTRQHLLSPLSLPASLSVPLSSAPTSRPPRPLSVWQEGGAHPTTSVTRFLLFSDGQTPVPTY